MFTFKGTVLCYRQTVKMPRPSKSVELTSYHVRVNQVEGVDDAALRSWLDSTDGRYLVVFEEADDEVAHPHYHIKLEVPWTRDRLNAALRKEFPNLINKKGETQLISVKQTRDGEALVLYLLKGKDENTEPKVVGHHGFEYNGTIVQKYNQWWRNKKAFKESVAKKQVTVRQLCDDAVKDLPPDPLVIAKAVLEVYLEADKPINKSYIASMVRMYLAKKCAKYRRRLAKDIAMDVALGDLKLSVVNDSIEEDGDW